jgi:capsule polysaccharide export protein KpsE/RkpR
MMDRPRQTTLETLNDAYLAPSVSMHPEDLPSTTQEPRLIVLLRLLWPRRSDLCKATLVGLVLAAAVAVLIPKTYQATVRLMPPDSSSISGSSSSSALLGMALGMGPNSSGSGGGGLSSALGDLFSTQKPGPLFIGILSSRTISDRMIDRFDLRRVYWRKTYGGARKKLFSRVTFSEDKKSGLISIIVEDRDRARAAAMASAYVEELNALLSHVNDSAASRERQFLEKRLVSVNLELQDVTTRLSEFSSHNATLDPQDQGKAMLDSAAVLEGQLIAAKSELSGLQQIYTDQNVRMRSLQAHISELEHQLNAFGGKDYNGSPTLDKNSLYPSIRQLPVLGREYLELYRHAKVEETVFELLTEACEMAKVEEAKDTPSAKILDNPRLPETYYWPPRMWFAIAGALIGFLSAAGWIVGAEHWASLDPNAAYKAFLDREVLPALHEKLVPIRQGYRQMVSRIRGSGERRSA